VSMPLLVRGGRAGNRRQLARNATGCGSLAAPPLAAPLSPKRDCGPPRYRDGGWSRNGAIRRQGLLSQELGRDARRGLDTGSRSLVAVSQTVARALSGVVVARASPDRWITSMG
jgi:hypothetical protein